MYWGSDILSVSVIHSIDYGDKNFFDPHELTLFVQLSNIVVCPISFKQSHCILVNID